MDKRQASVIICTRNRAALLPGLIGQLRAQHYPAEAFEIIVIDNGSTDDTRSIVEGLAAEPGVPVRYVAEQRPGITFARNRGAEAARFPYLAYIDDDCGIEVDWLSQLMSGFDLSNEVALVGGRVALDFGSQQVPAWFGSGSGAGWRNSIFPVRSRACWTIPIMSSKGIWRSRIRPGKTRGGSWGWINSGIRMQLRERSYSCFNR
jgi:glycosyltransferase involved in cell wall biosynthesis